MSVGTLALGTLLWRLKAEWPRELLAEIEAMPWGRSVSPNDLANRIHSEYEKRLRAAAARLEGHRWKKVAGTVVGLVAGVFIGMHLSGVAGVEGVTGKGAEAIGD